MKPVFPIEQKIDAIERKLAAIENQVVYYKRNGLNGSLQLWKSIAKDYREALAFHVKQSEGSGSTRGS